MADLALKEIAQIIVPDDGGRNPTWVVPDWDRNFLYFVGTLGGWAIRKYNAEIVTQTPTISVSQPGSSWTFGVDVDPVSGSLIIQRSDSGIPNGTPIRRLDPNTFEETGKLGIQTSYPNFPNSIWVGESLVCAACGSFEGPQVGYIFHKYSVFSGAVAVFRADTMQHSGFFENVVSGTVDNRGLIIRGRSGNGGASCFLIGTNTIGNTHLPIWTVEVYPGAETYDPGSWPSTNPFISQRVIRDIYAGDIDGGWSTIQCDTMGYDTLGDSLILLLHPATGGTAPPSDVRIVRVDVKSGNILWIRAVSGHVMPPGLPAQYIPDNVVGMLDSIQFLQASTLDGAQISLPFGGVIWEVGGFHVSNSVGYTIEAITPNLFFVGFIDYDGTRPNAPQPVAGTPTAFSGYAMLGPPPPPPPVVVDLLCCDRYIMVHLYEFMTATGIRDHFTDFDADVYWNGDRYRADGLRFEGLQRKIGIGLSVDEQTMKIWASPTDTIFGANFLTAVEEGILDGAIITRRRLIWGFFSGQPSVGIGGTGVLEIVRNTPPLVAWTLFTGYTSSITKGGASHVEMKVKSALLRLNVNMPRNYYQPQCLWTLFDQGCTVQKNAYAHTSTVQSANQSYVAPVGGVSPRNGPDGIPYFKEGRLLFNSGVNAGLQVLIGDNDDNNLTLAYRLNNIPAVGDSITYYPGCSKSFTTCQQKFNNTANFRGFDKVPPVVVSA